MGGPVEFNSGKLLIKNSGKSTILPYSRLYLSPSTSLTSSSYGCEVKDNRFCYFLLRVATSNMTAPASTRALTIYWMEMSQPSRFIPFVRDAMTNAPRIEPVTLPTPPATAAPPTKAAAMASNSMPVAGDRCGGPQPGCIQDTRHSGQQAHRAKNQEGDLLHTDAVQLSRLWVSADGVDMPADDRLGGDVGIKENHEEQETAAQERPWYPASTQVMPAITADTKTNLRMNMFIGSTSKL